MAVPVASNTLSVNVFTAPGKTMVGERPKPFGEPFGFDPITSTLIFGEYDAVLAEELDTPAKMWCLENPPTCEDATTAILSYLLSMDLAALCPGPTPATSPRWANSIRSSNR